MPFSSKNKSLLIWFLVVLAAFVILSVGSHQPHHSVNKVSYTEMIKVLEDARSSRTSASITIQGNSWKLVTKDVVYVTTAPLTDGIIEDLSKHENLEVRFIEPPEPSIWVSVFITWLPFLIIFYFFVVFQ